jgi:glycosyltransferase involved in cell wall biosynthesis
MHVAVWVGLSDKKCLEHLQGLDDCNLVSKGLLFRRWPIDGLQKFRQVCPPEPLRRSLILSHLYVFFSSVLSCMAFRPDVCIGISMLPHSVMAKIAQCLTGSKFVNWLIGTDMYVEIHRGWLGRKLFLPMVRSAASTLCMGQYSKDILISLGWNEERVIVGRNSYNFSDFYALSPQERWDEGKWDVIYIGRLDRYHKRVDLLLGAIAEMKKQRSNVTCAIVGDGPDSERLKKLSCFLDIVENVFFLGQRSDIPRCLNDARIFAMTPSWEGLPSSIVEAMACGVPVITSNVGDVDDIIENGSNGILVNSDHPEAYAKVMLNLLNDRLLYESMSHKAMQTGESIKKAILFGESAKRWESALRKGKSVPPQKTQKHYEKPMHYF